MAAAAGVVAAEVGEPIASVAALREGSAAAALGWLVQRPRGWRLETDAEDRSEIDEERLADGSWLDPLSIRVDRAVGEFTPGLGLCRGTWRRWGLEVDDVRGVDPSEYDVTVSQVRKHLSGWYSPSEIASIVSALPESVVRAAGEITAVGDARRMYGLEIRVQRVTSRLARWIRTRDSGSVVLRPTVWRKDDATARTVAR